MLFYLTKKYKYYYSLDPILAANSGVLICADGPQLRVYMG
jgi:hypothetical protein